MEKSILVALSGFSVRRFAVLLCVAAWAFSACGETSAKWIRFTIMAKYSWSNSSKDKLSVSELCLLDANGVQQGVGLRAIDPSTSPAEMPEGTCLVTTPYTVTSADVARLFDGALTGSSFQVTDLPTQSKEPYCLMSVSDSSTWTYVYARLPDSASPVASYLLYVGQYNYSGSEQSIARWKLDASFDGETWFTVHDQSSKDATRPTAVKMPYNGGTPYQFATQGALHLVTVDSAETNAFDAAYANDVLVEKTGAGTVTTTSGFDRAFLHVAEGTLAVSPEGSATAALAGVTSVSNGATLAMSGDVAMPRLVNGDGAVSLSSGATLLASASAGVTNYLYGGGISGAGGVEVSGGGVVEMDGANAYSGDTLVRSGTLRLGRVATTPAKWFRIIFKTKFKSNSNPGSLNVGEFAIYDAETNQVNAGLSVIDSPVPAWQMGPGTCEVEFGGNFSSARLASLVNGVAETDASLQFTVSGLPTSGGYPAMSAGDSSTWVTVTLRLADNAAAACMYNLYVGHYNWSGTERSPNGWTVQASCDGRIWFDVDDRRNVSSPGGNKRWYNSGVPFAFSAPAFDAANAIPAASILEVASGAAVESVGGAASVSRLRIDCTDGAGTLSGVSFASGGALYLVNAGGYEYGASLPLTVSGAADVANLATWTVYREGAEISGAKFKIKDGLPTVDCSGFLLIYK